MNIGNTLADKYGPYSQFKANGKTPCENCNEKVKDATLHHQTDTMFCSVRCMIQHAEKDIFLYGTASNYKCLPQWHSF